MSGHLQKGRASEPAARASGARRTPTPDGDSVRLSPDGDEGFCAAGGAGDQERDSTARKRPGDARRRRPGLPDREKDSRTQTPPETRVRASDGEIGRGRVVGWFSPRRT